MVKELVSEKEIVESVIIAVEGILRLPILPRHTRGLISGLLWTLTEARGKYTTRFRSRASLMERGAKLQHEHVYTRKDTDRILADPARAREILALAVACVVTVEEHKRLAAAGRQNPSLRGWDRYVAAGIDVVDMDAVKPVTE